jgi:hypothetical protein
MPLHWCDKIKSEFPFTSSKNAAKETRQSESRTKRVKLKINVNGDFVQTAQHLLQTAGSKSPRSTGR